MRPAMYIFINRSLGMSPGKVGAQAAHAAVEAYRLGFLREGEWWKETGLTKEWYKGGHYCKLVMLAEDDVHLMVIKHYIEERSFKTKLIIDEGHTEIRPHSMTALGVEVVDRDDPHTAATFQDFKLYKEKTKQPSLDDLQVMVTKFYGSDYTIKRKWWSNEGP